MNEKKKMYTV